MAPPAPRRFFFTSSLAVELIDLHASSSTRSTAAKPGTAPSRNPALRLAAPRLRLLRARQAMSKNS